MTTLFNFPLTLPTSLPLLSFPLFLSPPPPTISTLICIVNLTLNIQNRVCDLHPKYSWYSPFQQRAPRAIHTVAQAESLRIFFAASLPSLHSPHAIRQQTPSPLLLKHTWISPTSPHIYCFHTGPTTILSYLDFPNHLTSLPFVLHIPAIQNNHF